MSCFMSVLPAGHPLITYAFGYFERMSFIVTLYISPIGSAISSFLSSMCFCLDSQPKMYRSGPGL